MRIRFALSSDDSLVEAARWKAIAFWWNEIFVGDDPGATTWEVLERLQQEVTDCRAIVPPDLGKAESITAKALHLVAGHDLE